MLPAALTAMAFQICAAMLTTAGPLSVSERNFANYGPTALPVFDACAVTQAAENTSQQSALPSATISRVTALLRQSFGARITNTMRPINASYGARYSWHKVGQAIDFVPAGGVGAIDRAHVLALMAANGIRLIELLGPGDRGHANHWHIAFARHGQIIDHSPWIEEGEDWILPAALTEKSGATMMSAETRSASETAMPSGVHATPAWDVFAVARSRMSQGGGS